ncbi:hypothetical protein AB8A31_11030 [Tardiphaga sp. 804_B3_N1_9]|uniref:hypothetical protein n=1 Tax=Tardiphaga TaxID=1395974 RepID=UPI00158635A8|nr:hypothetical protein [Tardiphaga robiniae]NUU42941.1 hypothetical protein [Tardiphaga robiniae]
MFEIEGSHIAELTDADLRSLVGLLCEAELRAHGLSTSAVTWGGNQNATDGGIDVRVRIQDGVAPGGFLPRASIGFQVKKSDLTPGLITPEMRPSGSLRVSISDLIAEGGAYIIASSGSDTSDTALADRVNIMRSAVADDVRNAEIQLDFYDRSRLATWTRAHVGLIVWVRQKIGRGMSGWQPYSSWAVSPDGIQDEYLLDDKARLHAGVADNAGCDVAQGVDRVRNALRDVRSVVRLAGLSGVGKTRFVQALFDDRVGKGALSPSLVIYTDMNDNPSPQPTGMISDLIASRTRAIVVVDNCAPELHRRITEVCRTSDSLISAVTVEYDVQEDEPEGTEVFRLEPSSVDLVSKLIARRFSAMTPLDVDKIAEFSGGNARVALALANTLERHESVAGLQDEELFKRLFQQRQERDDNLLTVAKACALLYSFQGEALSGDEAELPKIAALVGMSTQQVFAKVSQLKGRDLVQRRSVWRAVLPHAISNRLAKMALREIHLDEIEKYFDTERLLKSFSRRLGYLHESDEARRIVEKWLAKDGLLANVGRLNEFGMAMFNNIAPVSPEATLAAIERELSESVTDELSNLQLMRRRIASVLHSIAYDALLFDRCAVAMISLAIAEAPDSRNHPAEDALKGLFQLFLSGSHANIEQRLVVVDRLLHSSESRNRSLGVALLRTLLQGDHFSATQSFEFGAWVRDYGYWPSSREERAHWFVSTLKLIRKIAESDDQLMQAIRSSVAQAIQGLWFFGPEVQDQFEAIAEEVAKDDYWQEGWIAVRIVLSRSLDDADAAAIQRLRNLERRLCPKNVTEQVRAVVLTPSWGALDYADTEGRDEADAEKPMAAYERANAAAEELGKVVCRDGALFASLLPSLVIGDGGRLPSFGKGLALASIDFCMVWAQLTHALAEAEDGRRNIGALIGFLVGLSTMDRDVCEAILEAAVEHDVLGAWFPILQTSIPISIAGAGRLKRAAAIGKARASAFHSLGWGRSSDAISGEDLRDIITILAGQENGYGVAVDILSMRFHSDADQKKEYPKELIVAGRSLLSSPIFSVSDNMHDHRLGKIAGICLRGAEGVNAAKSLCERIRSGLADYTFRAFNHPNLLSSIFASQSRVALDVFFGGVSEDDDSDLGVDYFDSPSERRRNALDEVTADEMLRWCDEKPLERYRSISRVISYHATSTDGVVDWTPLAVEMFKRAPDPLVVLATFVERFSPKIWSGSRAAIVESRLPLLDRLKELENTSFADYVTQKRPELVDEIVRIRRWENERDSERDERFE